MSETGSRCRVPGSLALLWKFVKLFAFGTKVFSNIPHDFHHNTLKEFWPVYSLNLVS
jgi:hypothetical protein